MRTSWPRHHGSSGTDSAPPPSAASLSGGCPPSSRPTCTCSPVLRPIAGQEGRGLGSPQRPVPPKGQRPGQAARAFPGRAGVLGTPPLDGPHPAGPRSEGPRKGYLGKAATAPTQQPGPSGVRKAVQPSRDRAFTLLPGQGKSTSPWPWRTPRVQLTFAGPIKPCECDGEWREGG